MPRFDLDAARWIEGIWAGRLRCLADVGRGLWRVWDADVTGVFADDDGVVVARILGVVADAFATAMDRVEEEYRLRGRLKRLELEGAGRPDAEAKAAAEEVVARGTALWKPWRTFTDRLRMDAGQNALKKRLSEVCATSWREFDTDVRWLAFRNGVIDLDRLRAMAAKKRGSGTGGALTLADVVIEPHSPDRLITQVAGVEWRPAEVDAALREGAAAGISIGGWLEWSKALGRALPPTELRRWLRRALGGAMLGEPEKRLFNLIGVSNSGKSMLLGLCKSVFGDYVAGCNIALFIKGERVDPFELDSLRIARMVTAAEPDKGGAWNSGFLKQVTGLDPIHSRSLYRSSAASGGEWLPRFSLWIGSNFTMRFASDDKALSMRLTPIPFGREFRLDVRDGGVEEVTDEFRLDKELPVRLSARGAAGHWAAEGFAVWCVEGLLEWLSSAGSGIEATEVMRARSDMGEEVDSVREWVRVRVEAGELAVTQHAAPEVRAQPWVKTASVEWGSVGGGLVMVPGSVGSGRDGLIVDQAYWSYRRWWEDEYGTGGDMVGGGGGRFARKKNAFVDSMEGLYGEPTKTVGHKRFPGLVGVIGRWKPEPSPSTPWTGWGSDPD